MKITKYPQSCLMIETNNKKILVDPGKLKYEDRFLEEWKEADINYERGFRNQQRIVYSNDGLAFVTYDHYRTFVEIVLEEEIP